MKKKFLLLILFIVIVGKVNNAFASICSIYGIQTCSQHKDEYNNSCVWVNNKCVSSTDGGSGGANKNMSCKIITIRANDKKISFTFYEGDRQRTGYIYRMNLLGNDQGPAFCLDPGNSNNTTYHQVRELSANNEIDRYYAKVYQWYLDHNDLDITQLAIWYVAEKERTGTAVSTKELGKMLYAYFSKGETTCSSYETKLREKFKNNKFTCKCYFDRSISGCNDKKKYSKNTCKKDLNDDGTFTERDSCYQEVTSSEYSSAIDEFRLAGDTSSQYQYLKTESDWINKATEILTWKMYKGEGTFGAWLGLYIYEPDGGTSKYQRLLGIGACKYQGYLCDNEYPNYLAGKYGKDLRATKTIENFKNALVDPERVKIKEDGTAYCGNPVGLYCADLLATGNYVKYQTCDQLKAAIDDAPNVTDCNDSLGYVSYLECGSTEIKCDPETNMDYAKCHKKDEGKSVFTLKDATTTDASGNDIPNLACIEKNIAYKIDSDKIASKDDNLSSSKYCDVYCWESLYATMPNEPAPVKYVWNGFIPTGRLFFWGTDYGKKEFANFQVQRICWSKNIDYDQFKTDWYNNENSIAQEYANYLARKDYNEKNSGVEKGDKCCYGGSYTSEETTSTCIRGSGTCPASGCKCEDTHTPYTQAWLNETCTCTSSKQVCSSGTEGNWYNKKESEAKYTSVTGTTFTGKSGKASDICALSEPEASKFTVSNSTDTLKAYISNRNTLKNSIRACQSTITVNTSTIYKHTATIELVDNFNLGLCDTRGVCGEDLKLTRNIENESIETNRVPNGSFAVGCTDVGEFNSGNPCAEDGGTTIPTYDKREYEWDYKATESFVFGEKFHFYAQADTDFVANRDYHTENFEYGVAVANGLIYDVGTGIPTFIERYSGHFDITVNMSKLGNDGHFDKVATSSKEKYGYDLTNYACPYDLAKIIVEYCPPTDPKYPCEDDCCEKGTCPCGISIIYRIIEMGEGDQKKIFPGNSGNGRKPGENWATFITNNFEKFKRITTTSKIYGRKPLYTIELSPTLIGEIRRDNNSYRGNNMDPYTSYKDTNGKYKITCTKGNDKTCTSEYITSLITKGRITGLLAINDSNKRRESIEKYKTTGNV